MSKLWKISTATAFLIGAAMFMTPALAGKGQSHDSTVQSQTKTTGTNKPKQKPNVVVKGAGCSGCGTASDRKEKTLPGDGGNGAGVSAGPSHQ